MSKPIIKLVNAETGEEIEREMTNAEYTQYQAEQEIIAAKLVAESDLAAKKAAVLNRLGITEDEAKALLA